MNRWLEMPPRVRLFEKTTACSPCFHTHSWQALQMSGLARCRLESGPSRCCYLAHALTHVQEHGAGQGT